MNKYSLLKELMHILRGQWESAEAAAQAAAAAATHEESKPENEYDTRGLEASYLASAQAVRARELKRSLQVLEQLPLREFKPEDAVDVGALVEAECHGKCAHYFFLPAGAGVPLMTDGKPILILTPSSRLGQEFRGKHVGDEFTIDSNGQVREYTILSIS